MSPLTAPTCPATTMIVALHGRRYGSHTGQAVAALVALASQHELVVVSGGTGRAAGDSRGHSLVAGLRLHLPRHRILAVAVDADPHPHEVTLIAELLTDGALPVVLTATDDPAPVAVLLARALGADHGPHVVWNQADDLLLEPPWAAPASA